MCLEVGVESKLKTAEADIKVYKVVCKVGENYYTPHRESPISIGRLIEAPGFQTTLGLSCREITVGIHTFKHFKGADAFIGTLRHKGIYWQMHYISDKGTVIGSLTIWRATIPKGSLYWEGTFLGVKSYCSNQIIYELEI